MTLDESAFKCPGCGRVSHNPNDVRERYCGACKRRWDEHAQLEEQMRQDLGLKGLHINGFGHPPPPWETEELTRKLIRLARAAKAIAPFIAGFEDPDGDAAPFCKFLAAIEAIDV